MEKKGRKAKTKKIIAILCIFVVLQSYFSYFAQIAIATSDLVIGEENNETSDDVTIGSEEQQNPEDNDPAQNEVTPPADEEQDDPVVGEDPDDGETVIGGDQNTEDPDSSDPQQPDEQEPSDGPISEEDNPSIGVDDEQENPDEPDVSDVPEEPEEQEPYVEPEATIEVNSDNSSVYKGYLYANATSDLGYETFYNTNDVITIVGGKNLASLTVQEEPDKIGQITNTIVHLEDQTYYRQTRVSIEEFNNILGENGSITVYSSDGAIIGYINKDCIQSANGEYVITYPMQLNSMIFEFTNIINDGTISIKNDKAIKDTFGFSRNQISLFATIITKTNVNLYEEGKEVKTYDAEGSINLEETESKMLLDVDTTTLAVEGKNEVALNVTLKTDEERYDLFENPTIDIEFPSAIDDVNITSMSLLYKNGLSIGDWNVDTNSMGKKILRVNLTGSQSEYTPGAVHEGTTLVIYTEIDVDRLTADSSDVLKMTYTNKDAYRRSYILEGKDSENIEIGFVGRQELVRSITVTEADVATATSYDEETRKNSNFNKSRTNNKY